MGWGRTLLLGDIGNRLDIEDTERDITSLKNKARTGEHIDRAQDARLQALEEENDQLKLYVASLMRLLVSKGVVTQEELVACVDIIDAEEGDPGDLGGADS